MARTGRPLGTQHRKTTHQHQGWTWDGDNLLSKIKQAGDLDCWTWLGSRGPQGNLFGAYLNDQPRITQANRLIYTQFKGRDFTDVSIRMRCGNRYCCNPNHFNTLEPNYRNGQKKPPRPVYKFSLDDERFMSMTTAQQEEIRNLAREFSQDNGVDWEWRLRWMKIVEEDLVLAELKYPGVLAQFARSRC